MLNTPFPDWPNFSDEEVGAAARVLASNRVNYWTGTECREFEKEFAEWVGARHAVALSNGTVALDAALHAAGVGPGDDVVVSSRAFVASASSIVMAGARPVFADVDPDTQNVGVETIESVLTPQCKSVVCLHLAGMPCDMDPILELAEAQRLIVIEDCAQAHGARYKGRSVGTIGHIGTWSFCQDKIMSTGGEGGMVTTDDPGFWSAMWSYKDHGKSWDAVYKRDHPPGYRWLHESFGTNGRMLEMQAAIGRIQLCNLADWSIARRRNMERIYSAASSLPGLRVPEIPHWAEHAAYKCYLFVDEPELCAGWDRDRIMAEINDRGVPCYTGTCSEVYREKAFVDRGIGPPRRLPVASKLGDTSLMFLVHPTLTEENIETTCSILAEVMARATDHS